MTALLALVLSVLSSPFADAACPDSCEHTVVLVDKKDRTLFLAEYQEPRYRMIKKYRATLGKVMGDKEEEGDMKTPEGVYSLTSLLRPPAIKAKFGKMAFYVNYPNKYDQLAGRTGFDIMLHATDAPERLEKEFDSEGCVVINNEEIEEIRPYIRLGLTPFIVFDELTDNYLQTVPDQKLKTFFETWVQGWETKNIEQYIGHYHSEFTSGAMDRKEWKTYKTGLNKRYRSISLGATYIRYFRHPKYSVVMFNQNYRSVLNNGRPGYHSLGTKILYVAEEDGQPKILAEDFTKSVWKPIQINKNVVSVRR